jgi:hypothetical protein
MFKTLPKNLALCACTAGLLVAAAAERKFCTFAEPTRPVSEPTDKPERRVPPPSLALTVPDGLVQRSERLSESLIRVATAPRGADSEPSTQPPGPAAGVGAKLFYQAVRVRAASGALPPAAAARNYDVRHEQLRRLHGLRDANSPPV